VARALNIGSFLELSLGEETSGGRTRKPSRRRPGAIIAAIYLDGGIDRVRAFVLTYVMDAPFTGDEDRAPIFSPGSPISRTLCSN